MNRWEALVEIVKSFNAAGRPGYALTTVLVIMLAALGITGLASLGMLSLSDVSGLLR